ncbi:hypothetical protein [Natrinema sp. DC36]|uniref:hypothetical protein n=1 Tax=Natrinema sp. DC36 TaxID=2878680 RepID=UPI001CF0598C|nr:hypothetical protein [Natrinema sp. DC36]
MPTECAESGCPNKTDSGICQQCAAEQKYGTTSRAYDADGTRVELRAGETRDDSGHSSAVNETLANADAEDLETAGIDPDDVKDEDEKEIRTDGGEPTGHCVLCSVSPDAPRDEHTTVPMEIELEGDVLEGDVRVCEPHYDTIRRCLIVQSDAHEYPDDDPKTVLPDGGTVTTGSKQARLSVGDTRKPIALKNARRVTTGDLSTLAMCAHRFEPADVMGWYTHEYDDVLREWICSNDGSVIARLSPHCEDTRGDCPPIHPSDDLWVGPASDRPTQATLEDMEGGR